MLNLNGLFNLDQLLEITEYTKLRLQDSKRYICAEALALYEQHLLPEPKIKELCERAYGCKLEEPISTNIPLNILNEFKNNLWAIPVNYNRLHKVLTCATLPEFGSNVVPIQGITIKCVKVPIYKYFEYYTDLYGKHVDLLPIPTRTLYDMVINEAIDLHAADITISSTNNRTQVYYNIKKKKVFSHVIMDAGVINDIVSILTIKSPIVSFDNKPKYVGIDLNDNYRGRVVINKKYKGFEITIRLLPNSIFNNTLEDCNLKPETIEFLREDFMNRENGLRLLVGSTMSGKNTTCLSVLNEIVQSTSLKVVTVEMPVEVEMSGIEQINCDTLEEYKDNINSLIRQNPDFLYITEMNDETATDVMRIANTGKRALSTLHANSCSDTIARLMDITGLSLDRVLQPIHSIVYQELRRIEELDMLIPVNRYVYLTQEKKNQLYNKSFGEVVQLLQSWEGGDVW